MRSMANSRDWIGGMLLALFLAPQFGGLLPRSACAAEPSPAAPVEKGQAAVEAPTPAAKSAAPRAPHQRKAASLEDRVQLISKGLDLDPRQEAALRAVLEDQRKEIRKLWDDTSIPAGERIHATQAISDRTADRIRALLNEEQRKKYNPPRPPRDTTTDPGRPSVEDWMKASQPK